MFSEEGWGPDYICQSSNAGQYSCVVSLVCKEVLWSCARYKSISYVFYWPKSVTASIAVPGCLVGYAR